MPFEVTRALDDKYQILREIKKGGFGIVYYGLDKKLNKPVAIKEIAPNLLDDPKYLDMFEEEALNIAKLSHNNIVHIYELKKTARDHLYIIMEYIDGTDLEKIIRQNKKNNTRIPAHMAVHIVAEICMALDYAHQRRDSFTNKPLNLVHQDISPSNIMISCYGGVKLIDFGIASVRRHHKDKKDDKLRGKIPYMAPEQLLGSKEADPRSDLFSLGLVLLEALTGDRLFQSQEELITQGRNAKFFKKALKGKKITTPLVRILLKALDPDIEKRYQSANHMYIDLLQYLISCNETGELMDDLADYVTQFEKDQPTFPLTPTPETPVDLSSYLSTTQISVPAAASWQVSGNTPSANGGLSAALRPAHTETSLRTDRPPKHPVESPQENSSEVEDNLKTIIDVIRIGESDYRKKFTKIAAMLLLAGIGFMILDTVNRWTMLGVWLFDTLFPPAIEIVTVPPHAQVELDGRPLAGQTPLAIEKISPGVHRLQISLAGYRPLVKSVFVPRQGDIEVQGENRGQQDRTYTLHFVSDVTVDSNPPGADIIINGKQFSQKTPAVIPWQSGSRMGIELRWPGFEPLRGYVLDTVSGYDEVEDRRLWHLEVYNDAYKKYHVTGNFRKRVNIIASPRNVEVIDLGTNQRVGTLGTDKELYLGAGPQRLEFSKVNFKSKILQLQVDADFNETVRVILEREVRFSARSPESGEKDVGALVTSIKANGREYLRTPRRTPFGLSLPATAHTVIFEKQGYRRQAASLDEETRSLSVQLESLATVLDIEVVDALTNSPVTNAQIYYNSVENPQTLALFLDETDLTGGATGKLTPGNYTFKIRKRGYVDLDKVLLTRPGQMNLAFKLSPIN